MITELLDMTKQNYLNNNSQEKQMLCKSKINLMKTGGGGSVASNVTL